MSLPSLTILPPSLSSFFSCDKMGQPANFDRFVVLFFCSSLSYLAWQNIPPLSPCFFIRRKEKKRKMNKKIKKSVSSSHLYLFPFLYFFFLFLFLFHIVIILFFFSFLFLLCNFPFIFCLGAFIHFSSFLCWGLMFFAKLIFLFMEQNLQNLWH